MKKGFLRIVAGALAFMMVFACVGSAAPAYASDGATKQEKVLTVTNEMAGVNGIITISGDWDRIVVPKEISASRIYFREVNASAVEIESGNNSRIELVSGEVGSISIVPAKLTQMTIQDLCELIRQSGNSAEAVKMYLEVQEQSRQYQEYRPTLVTGKDVTVTDMKVSGNVKLNLGNGSVENVKVDADGTQRELKVDISDYSGNVSVKQEENDDGSWVYTRVKLKNSSVESLVMEGEGNGSIILDGQKSEVKEVKVESGTSIMLDVPVEKVDIPETAGDVKLTVLDKVEEMQISATGTKVEVGNCGTVTSAKVEGDDVTIAGDGKLSDVEITGNGAAVSTPGTNVEGENTYTPPTIITPPSEPVVPPEDDESEVRDLGGLQIIVGDHWSPNFPVEPSNPEEEALQAYREEMMKKHNFTIKQVMVADWGGMVDTYRSSILLGNPVAQVFVLDYRFVQGNRHLFYDLSTLSELDFTEEKWADSVTEQMMFGDGIYGMAAGPEEPRGGVLFNKRLFEEAGLDPELPYELQKNGEWTWSKFTELCELLTRDTNGDGITDVYGQVSQDTQVITQLAVSTGNDFITLEDGKYVNNLDSAEIKEALVFAKEVINSEYSMQQPENSSWDWFMPAFAAGAAAMQFNEVYTTQPGQMYSEMEDELGFVCCPKPDGADSYHTAFYENIAVIPACYDEQTATDIAFAYNIWTNPAPGYESGTDWKEEYAENNLDERAFDETFEIFRQEGVGHAPQMYLLEDSTFFSQDLFWCWPYDNRSVDEVIATIKPEWDALVEEVNAKTKIDVVAPRPDGSGTEDFDTMFNYSIKDDGTMLITGYDDMDVRELIIPDELFGCKVTEIDENAFSGCFELESVVLPEGLLKIGRWAFASCESLESVIIPDGVTEIADYAFAYSTGLERVTIPASVTSIGYDAFWISWDSAIVLVVEKDSYAESYAKENELAFEYSDGTVPSPEFIYEDLDDGTVRIIGMESGKFSKIVVPEEIDGKAVTEIGANALFNISASSVVLPEGLKVIGEGALSWCRNLTELVIPESVTVIGNRAFECSGLTSIELPKNLEELGMNAFGDCSALTYIGVAEENLYFTSVDGVVYSKDKSVLVTVPSGLAIACYEIEEGTTVVKESAFDGCSMIQTVVIPAGVETIGYFAFDNCESLSVIEVSGDNLNYVSVDGVLFSKDMKLLVRMPEAKSGEVYVIPNGVEEIGYWSFFECKFTEVVIPEGVKYIDSDAFFENPNLTTVSLPESLVRIYGQAFGNCPNLVNIVLPSNLTELAPVLFQNCEKLTTLEIPNGVTSVETSAFYGCSSLAELVIPESVVNIYGVFEECPLLTLKVVKDSYADSYASQNGIPVIYMETEEKTDKFLYVETTNGTVAIIGYEMLASNKVDIPMELESKTVTAVSGGAFAGCATITCVHISESVTEIGEEAFADCNNLIDVVIPASVVVIAEDAFKNCMNISISTQEGTYAENFAREHDIPINYR